MCVLRSCEDLLREMVGFDTVNPRISGRSETERPLAEFLDAQAESWGLSTSRLEVPDLGFNLLVTHEVSADAPWLLFESHLDTVSVIGMTIDPFAGRVEGGRMYGRGACDTKGSGAAMLWALNQYREGRTQPNNVAVLYTLDEEINKTGAKAFVHDQLAGLDWRPAGVIAGEPTELRPVVAHNGVVRWTVRTRGLAAHSSDPAQGRSAIRMMVRVIDRIEKGYIAELKAKHPLTGKAACSINVIRGGTQVNIIPETCEIKVDRRVVPGEDPHRVLPEVERLLEGLRAEVPDLEVSQEIDLIDPALDPAEHESFIAHVRSVLASMSMPDESSGVGYGTDASTFGEAGIPAIVLGPGNIAQAHTCDEWLELDQLHRAVEVYGRLMSQPLEVRDDGPI